LAINNRFSTYHHEQKIVQIFTHETHQPNLIYIQVVLKILDFL